MLLWAPRHPERFRPVSQAAIDAGWRVATRRLTRWPDGDDAVFVVDTLGELMDFYACAQVAFVGGSLQDIGGHNMQIGRAHVCTPVTNAQLVCRLLLEKKNRPGARRGAETQQGS